MKEKFLIFIALIFLIVVLIGLNAASYVQKDKTPDSELNPNRSTFSTGATGTRAFYDLLSETGRRPTRWQEPSSALLRNDKNKPQTLIVIGRTRREFDEEEIQQTLRWVSAGGKLVVIDRAPPIDLIKTTIDWKVSVAENSGAPFYNLDPSDQKQMTEKTVAAKPVQPTIYTQRVNAVQPSRLAASINFEYVPNEKNSLTGDTIPAPPKTESGGYNNAPLPPPPPPPPVAPPYKTGTDKNATNGIGTKITTQRLPAPVAHLANNDKTLLVDFPYGSGRIVFLSDPYIVSNAGINLVDNAQLAINVVASGEGIIAFDEYHQGFGANENRLLNYFAETPAVAIFLQFAALIAFAFFTQSRRFARPLPEHEPNRLSKLEYVSAMAELQQRTRAYDLAIENIYTEFRRRATRLVGTDNFTVSLGDLSKLVSERTKLNSADVENILFKCEDIIRGEPTNKREVLELISRLREIEEKLGLKRQKGR